MPAGQARATLVILVIWPLMSPLGGFFVRFFVSFFLLLATLHSNTPYFTGASVLSRHYLTHQIHCIPAREVTGIILLIARNRRQKCPGSKRSSQAACNKLWERLRQKIQWDSENQNTELHCLFWTPSPFFLLGMTMAEVLLGALAPSFKARTPLNISGNAQCSSPCLTYFKTTHNHTQLDLTIGSVTSWEWRNILLQGFIEGVKETSICWIESIVSGPKQSLTVHDTASFQQSVGNMERQHKCAQKFSKHSFTTKEKNWPNNNHYWTFIATNDNYYPATAQHLLCFTEFLHICWNMCS